MPFVSEVIKGKGRDWWAVKETGDSQLDYALGEHLADRFLQWGRRRGAECLDARNLFLLLESMVEKGPDFCPDRAGGLRRRSGIWPGNSAQLAGSGSDQLMAAPISTSNGPPGEIRAGLLLPLLAATRGCFRMLQAPEASRADRPPRAPAAKASRPSPASSGSVRRAADSSPQVP